MARLACGAAQPGGPPLVVATSRALRKSTKGTGRRLGGPIDSASGLETGKATLTAAITDTP